jgi:ferredoxin
VSSPAEHGIGSSDAHTAVVDHDSFGALFAALRASGYSLIGPTIRDGAIVYDEISGTNDLPIGWTDVQDAARYTLAKRDDDAYFGYVVGPQSWKKFLFPPRLKLWSATKHAYGFTVNRDERPAPMLAFIGVRACELAAMGVQDTVFMAGHHQDPHYRARRENVFILAVNCVQAGGTCFCASMNTGPRVQGGYDMLATEVIEKEKHYFVITTESERAHALLKEVKHRPATRADRTAAWENESRATTQMGRKLNTQGLKDILLATQSHPRWNTVAERCLGCANCTMVCPTCFCSTVEDTLDLTGEHAERWRRWDSCFNQEFASIHGGSARSSTAARYRQWMSHKLATWFEQFGTSGCVGCGRCITWCPVGIDITAEAGALRQGDAQGSRP